MEHRQLKMNAACRTQGSQSKASDSILKIVYYRVTRVVHRYFELAQIHQVESVSMMRETEGKRERELLPRRCILVTDGRQRELLKPEWFFETLRHIS